MIEKALIYEILRNPKALDDLRIKSHYLNEEAGLFEAMFYLHESGEEVTYRNLAKETGKKILELKKYTNETEYVTFYQLQEKLINDYTDRELRKIFSQNAQNGYQSLTYLQNEIDGLIEDLSNVRREDFTVSDLLDETLTEVREQLIGGKTAGIELTTLPSLNRIIGGIAPVDVIGLYGIEKSTKTTLAHEILLDIGLNQGLPAALFSYEVWQKQLVQKTISMRLDVDMLSLRNPKGRITEEELNGISVEAIRKLHNTKIFLYDQPHNELQIRAKLKKLKRQHGLKFAVIDHLLLVPCSQKFQILREKLNYLTTFFKQLAKEIKVPILIVSQASAQAERAAEGKGLERDADYFFAIHKLIKGEEIEYIDVNGNSQHHRAGESEYLVKNKGLRFALDGRSFITTFKNNKYVELTEDVDYGVSF